MRLDNMNISLMQLWYFTNVMEAGSFASASRFLNVTQSALRKSIASLEGNIEIQLFSRDGKQLVPTEAGRFLYSRWKSMLADMEEDLLSAQRYPGGGRRVLRIGTLTSHRSEEFLFSYVNRFSALCPDLEVEIERTMTDVLRKKLLEGEFDAAFPVLYEVEYGYWPGCEFRTIRECPHVACMLPSNPLADRESITVRDLEHMNLAAISAIYLPTYNQMLDDLFASEGIHPNIVYHSANASSQVYRLHGANDVFICDRYHRDYQLQSLLYKPIHGTRSGVAMVWNRESLSPELRSFLRLFEAPEV